MANPIAASVGGPFATVTAFKVEDPDVDMEMNGFGAAGGLRINLGDIANDPAFCSPATGRRNEASDTERNCR